jgi:hypothetical protein
MRPASAGVRLLSGERRKPSPNSSEERQGIPAVSRIDDQRDETALLIAHDELSPPGFLLVHHGTDTQPRPSHSKETRMQRGRITITSALLLCSCNGTQYLEHTRDSDDASTSESDGSSTGDAFELVEPIEPRPTLPEPSVTAPPEVQAWASNARCCNDGTDDSCNDCSGFCFCLGTKQLVYCDPCGAGSECEGWIQENPPHGLWDCEGIARADLPYGDVIENDCMDAGCEATYSVCEPAPLDDDGTPYKCNGQDAESESQLWADFEESGFALCCPVNGMGVMVQSDPSCGPVTDDGGCPDASQALFTCESKVGTHATNPPCVGWRLAYGNLTDSDEQRAHDSLDCSDVTEDGCYEMIYDCDGVLLYYPGDTVAWEATDATCAE